MTTMRCDIRFLVVVVGVLCGSLVWSATAVRAQSCERVSVNDRGRGGDGPSSGPALNANGEFAAFYSNAPNLTCGDHNAVRDVFVRDRALAHTARTSLDSNGGEAIGASQPAGVAPALSADGRLVAFSAVAPDLVVDDHNNVEDVFLRDRVTDATCPETGATVRLSVGRDGAEANGPSSHPALSADGCCVAFQSLADNLVGGDTNQASDVFLSDCRRQEILLVSTAPGDAPAVGDSITPAVSGDCAFVAFASAARNLVEGDTNGVPDIFVREMASGRVTRVSVDSSGREANGTSFFPAINFDGSVVAFKSDATNLVPSDTNAAADVFVHDRATADTERVSVDSFGNEANGFSGPPKVSGSGRFVVFPSWASNLVADDHNGFGDVFVRDRVESTTERVTCGVEPNSGVPDLAASISADGDWIAFASLASNLVPEDLNNALDVFVVRRAPCTTDASCDDGNPCTVDRCDPVTAGCLHETESDGTPCSDGLFCNGAETCRSGLCAPAAAPACDDCAACDEARQTCEPRPDGASCADDGKSCTADTCLNGACTHPVTDGQCLIDGLCLPDHALDPTNRCRACDAATDPTHWSPLPDGTSCTDGLFCNGAETCDDGSCRPGTPPCPSGTTCDEAKDQCAGPGARKLDRDGCQCDIHAGARPRGTRLGLGLLPPALLLWLRRRAGRRRTRRMPWWSAATGALLGIALCGGAARARAGEPFVGADLGVSEPTNGNYRGNVITGGTANPFAGYMFDEHFGVQGQLHFTVQQPDQHNRGVANQNQANTVFGATVGPRLAWPLWDPVELYGVAQGGLFSGLSGRITHSAAGFSVGTGLDWRLDPHLAVGLFGRWNRAYMSPHPADLGPLQVPSERYGEDITWLTAGVGVRYTFAQPAAVPAAAPAPPPPMAAPEVLPAPAVKRRFVLRSVHFDFDKFVLRPDSFPVLDEAAEILKAETAVRVVVEGHTDGVGTPAYNQVLSERRALSVLHYLVGRGIAAERLRAIGLGKSLPVATNDTDDGRAQNRRVELRIEGQ